MAAQIDVYPDGDGWRWRNGDNTSDRYDSRNQAFEDALVERTDERIVLLRPDGSEHGELYHARGGGGLPQRVDLLAASVRDEAVSVDG